MSAGITPNTSYTFSQGIEIISGGNQVLIKEVNDLASSIIQKIVRSLDENYSKKPFEALMHLLLELDPDSNLEKTPLKTESFSKFIAPEKPGYVQGIGRFVARG